MRKSERKTQGEDEFVDVLADCYKVVTALKEAMCRMAGIDTSIPKWPIE